MFNSNVQLRICNCNCDPQTVLETPNKCQLLIIVCLVQFFQHLINLDFVSNIINTISF